MKPIKIMLSGEQRPKIEWLRKHLGLRSWSEAAGEAVDIAVQYEKVKKKERE